MVSETEFSMRSLTFVYRWMVTVLAFTLIALLHRGSGAAQESARVIADARSMCSERKANDVETITVSISGGSMVVEVDFRCPLAEMMFECVEARIDCDDDPETGIAGDELMIHAAVGSRFHPNSWIPGADVPRPLALCRAAYALPSEESPGDEEEGLRSWRWAGTLDPPEVEKNRLRFSVPVGLLRMPTGLSKSSVSVWFRVIGTASEHPIQLRIDASQSGTRMEIDGKSGDWAERAPFLDNPDDLHPSAVDLDILSLKLAYDAGRVFAALRLQGTRFGDGEAAEDDVTVEDRISFLLEPLSPGRGGVRRYEVCAGESAVDAPGFAARVNAGFVECAMSRIPEVGSYRVTVWTDAVRVDRVPDEGRVRVILHEEKR